MHWPNPDLGSTALAEQLEGKAVLLLCEGSCSNMGSLWQSHRTGSQCHLGLCDQVQIHDFGGEGDGLKKMLLLVGNGDLEPVSLLFPAVVHVVVVFGVDIEVDLVDVVVAADIVADFDALVAEAGVVVVDAVGVVVDVDFAVAADVVVVAVVGIEDCESGGDGGDDGGGKREVVGELWVCHGDDGGGEAVVEFELELNAAHDADNDVEGESDVVVVVAVD